MARKAAGGEAVSYLVLGMKAPASVTRRRVDPYATRGQVRREERETPAEAQAIVRELRADGWAVSVLSAIEGP